MWGFVCVVLHMGRGLEAAFASRPGRATAPPQHAPLSPIPKPQAWLSSIETVSSAGLGHEYYATPSKHIAYGFMAVAALLVVGFFAA
jgi:hypothetical protein